MSSYSFRVSSAQCRRSTCADWRVWDESCLVPVRCTCNIDSGDFRRNFETFFNEDIKIDKVNELWNKTHFFLTSRKGIKSRGITLRLLFLCGSVGAASCFAIVLTSPCCLAGQRCQALEKHPSGWRLRSLGQECSGKVLKKSVTWKWAKYWTSLCKVYKSSKEANEGSTGHGPNAGYVK